MRLTTSSDLFGQLVEKIEPSVRGEGFSKKGNVFYLRDNENWVILDFQKSQSSDVHKTIFTINLAVASSRLINFFSPGRKRTLPKIHECHWYQRIGFLLPSHEDKWWVLSTMQSIDEAVIEISQDLIFFAIPELRKYESDEALRDLWMSGVSPGLTEVQRLLNLSVLLVHIGPKEVLSAIVEKLRLGCVGRPTEAMVQIHLSRLEKNIGSE